MKRLPYALMTTGGTIGVIAAFLQTTEKIQLLKQTNKSLICDLNSVFSCTNVLNSWQSSVFGFPNSLMCLVFFTIFTSIGIAGLTGGKLARGLRLSIQALALFVLGFSLWFMWQSVYRINALCVLCLFCLTGLLLVNWAWLRINAYDLPVGAKARAVLLKAIHIGADTFIWITLALTIAFVMLIRFA